MDAFFELLDEAVDGGHRILVFSQFVTMLKVLRDEFEKRGISYCYLDGSTQDRLAQCQRFNQTPSIPVFLISLKAGGTGLNLTGADMVVHFDPWWNPAVEDQATDRAHRIGQKKTVYSIKLIAEHTVEEKVLAMQQRKQAIINATIGVTDEAVMSKLTFEDIKELIGL
jgi:SNF2 family DNA or RNA helicase